MNFLETLVSLGGVKPCPAGKYRVGMKPCPDCHGTGQILDLAPLLAKPDSLVRQTSQLLTQAWEGDRSFPSHEITDLPKVIPHLYVVGPQRASNLVYEVARQLGGTAVVAIPEWEDKIIHDPNIPEYRDKLGRRVREVWLKWAKEQPDPKASWLLSYDQLNEPDKEVDRRIGSAIWGDCVKEHVEFIARYHSTDCPQCNGDGTIDSQGPTHMCPLCLGTGYRPHSTRYRLSLPIPPDATVLFVTDRMNEKEMKDIVDFVCNETSSGRQTMLPYILCLVSTGDTLRWLDRDEYKVISLYQEKP